MRCDRVTNPASTPSTGKHSYLADVTDFFCLLQADLAVNYCSVKDHNRRLRAGVASSSAYLKNPPPEVVDFVIWSAKSGVEAELSTRVHRRE